MTDHAPPSAPLEWRIAVGRMLVDLDWAEADLIDIWVMNIWKEYGELSPVEAVNRWYEPHLIAKAQIKAGTHPYITTEIEWAKAYELAWGELVFGEYDWESTLDGAYEVYPQQGHRPAREVAQEDFDAMPEEVKTRYVNRVHPPKKVWVPPKE